MLIEALNSFGPQYVPIEPEPQHPLFHQPIVRLLQLFSRFSQPRARALASFHQNNSTDVQMPVVVAIVCCAFLFANSCFCIERLCMAHIRTRDRA